LQQQRGSGKTAVLVERIINKIVNENIDIDRLLVVTFTNAAASEMRERILDAIYKKIEENPENENLQKQITLINKASICTIDSFCLQVIKNNFYNLDITPNFRIADTSEIELLKQEVLEELFEEKYEEENIDFIKLINTYTSYRDDTPLKDLILKIYTYIQSNPFPKKWLNEKIEMFNLKDNLKEDFAKTIWGEILLRDLEEEVTDCILTLENIKSDLNKYPELDKFYKTLVNDTQMLETLKINLDSWDKAFEISRNIKFLTWPRDSKNNFEIKDIAKNTRDKIKERLKKKLDKILIYSSEDANQDIYDMYEILIKLENVILEFDEKFKKRKKEKNILDFNDIEHYALEILLNIDDEGNILPTDVAKTYMEKYTEIAIDEYQDSNLVQEYILNSISNGKNIFMVGDVKQSIYKFRQAKPELFLEKYDTYKLKDNKQEDDNLKIQLFKNFRSRENVLDFTNLIFDNLMSKELGDIDYTEEEYLNLGASYEKTSQNLNTEIDIIDLQENQEQNKESIFKSNENNVENEESETKEQEERIEDIELEAKFVAKRIKKLIDEKYQVYNNKKKEFRDITYKDIIILLRSTKNTAAIFEKEIIRQNMPVFTDSSSTYLDSIEIQTIMSLLKIIDNPLNDIPLVTVLRSYIGGFTDNDLIQIRLSDKHSDFYTTLIKAKLDVDKELKEKIERFIESTEKWRKEQEYLSLDELIWKIYTDTGYYNYVGLMPNGKLRQANLKLLFEKAKQYESASFKGLFNFIKFIEKLQMQSGDTGSAKLIGENEDVIRIMSIHKSKGLEFPVVFLSSTGKGFNLMDLNNSILLHSDIGIGVKYIDYDKQIEYDTLSKASIKTKLLTENLSEELRVLYVALTRAKEKLIITGISKDNKKEISKMKEEIDIYSKNEKKLNPILIKKYKKYKDWIQLVYLYNEENIKDICSLNVYTQKDVIDKEETSSNEEKIDVKKVFDNKKIDKDKFEDLKEILEYEYKYKSSISIPNKISVTKIKELQNKVEKEKVTAILPIPKFLRYDEDKITSAQKGTLIHLCMQKLNPKKQYNLNDIKELVEDLQIKKIITENEAKAINTFKVLNFTKSNLWNQMKDAKLIEQEKPFYINIPAKEIYNEDIEENVLVQGIIDLYYIDKNNNLVLVDYKTDYVEKEEELVEKYKLQLDIYKRALEAALKRKVDKVYIYSTCLEKEIEVEL